MKILNTKICFFLLLSMPLYVGVFAQQVITVVNTDDSGNGSLRDAIAAANLINGPVNIHFNIPGNGPHVIQMTNTLMASLGAQKVIDATTQPNYYLGIIELKSPSQNWGDGIRLSGDQAAVYGMKISNFGTGIRVFNSAPNAHYLIGDINKGNHFFHNSMGIFVTNINNPTAEIKGNLIEGPPAPFKGRAINVQTSNNIIGGILPGEGNTIQNNSETFCNCNTIGTNNIYRGNSASCNTLGITLSDGTAPNITEANTQNVSGVSTPNSIIDLYLYTNDDCPGNNACQGFNFIATTTSDSNGVWNIPLSAGLLEAGNMVTATNTQSGKSTSNFSTCTSVVAAQSIPECASLIYPGYGSQEIPPISTIFLWDSVPYADGYLFNIGTSYNDFNIISDSVVYGTSFELTDIDLPYGTVIYVLALPFNSAGHADGCTTYQFETAFECPSGHVFLGSQQEIDAFPSTYPLCTEIAGDLTISGADITNLHGLSNITLINGVLLIENNPLLLNLEGLNNLVTINNYLRLSQNPLLEGITALNNLSHLGYGLFFDSNPNLLSLDGLQGISIINDAITIYDCGSLSNLEGLNNIISIHGQLYIGYNHGLNNLQGMNALQSASHLVIYNNHSLQTLNGLNSLMSLSWGGLQIDNNYALEDISALVNLQTVITNISITSTALESLDGLDNIDPSGVWQLTIAENPSLQFCNNTFVCSYLNSENNAHNIYNNSENCNDISEILTTCDINNQCTIPLGYVFTTQEQIDAFPTMYEGCTTMNGELYIIGDFVDIYNLDSLIQIQEFNGSITIGSTLISNFSGLNNLKKVDYLYIAFNHHLENFQGLNNVDSIKFGIAVLNNNSLENLQGFDNLQKMGSLDIRNNNALIDLSGLENLTYLFGYIGITGNSAMQSISGIDDLYFENTPFGSPHLFIFDNPQLEWCGVSSICNFLDRPGKIVSIYNNAEGCNSRQQIEDSCLPAECEITCPDQITICMNEGEFQIQGAYPTGGIFSGEGVVGNNFDPTVAGIGDHIIEYQISENNCHLTCSFIITVNSEPTIINCPDNNVQLDWSEEMCGANAWYSISVDGFPVPEVSYEVSGVTQGYGQGTGSGLFLNVGINQITITASNECNTTQCVFDINIVDQIPPTITCPEGMILELNENCEASVVDFTVFAVYSDNCQGDLTLSQLPSEGDSLFGYANETVLFTLLVVDASENSTECTFEVSLISEQNHAFEVYSFDELIENNSEIPFSSNGTLFGPTYLYQPITHEFEIINISCTEIQLGEPNSFITITGINSDRFLVSEDLPAISLLHGERAQFSITYDAMEEGVHDADVTITTPNFSYQFTISGSALNVKMTVRGNGIPIENGSNEPTTNNLTDFGTVNFNGNRSRNFTIHNLGASPLHLNGTPRVQIVGEHADKFTVTLQPQSPVLSIQRSFTIRFDATDVGIFSATVLIENNDPIKNPYTFSIKASVPVPNMRLTGNNITIENGSDEPYPANLTDFGVRNLNSNTSHSIYVRNDPGSGLLVLTGNPRASISGPGAAMFTVTTQPVMNITSGGSSLLRIRYTPTAQGVHFATVTIPNNDPAKNPYTFVIKGATPNAIPYSNPIWQAENVRESKESFSAFPNPFHTSFTLSAPVLEKFTPAVMKDAEGKEIRRFNVHQGENSIDGMSLPPGMYYLSFPELEEEAIKLIKN